jgi:hypothetical protein
MVTGRRGRGWGAVVALLVVAPWAAECSWGGFAAEDLPLVVLFLGPVYGGAAVLIREVVRRRGGGWPATALLAAAFGVVQAGLMDQSLFNRHFLDDTGFAAQGRRSAATLLPGIGVSAEQLVDFVGNHVALSICAPIALVEALAGPARRTRPWLGRRGLVAVAILYGLGSLLIFSDDGGRKGFLLSPVQAAAAGGAAAALVAAALLPRWRRPPPRRPGRVPPPLLLGAVVLAAHLVGWFPSGWAGVGVRLAAAALVVGAVVAWSRRPGWGPAHVVAGWSAGLLAAAAGAWTVPTYAPASPASAVLADVAVGLVAGTLVTTAYRRAGAVTGPPAGGSPAGPGRPRLRSAVRGGQKVGSSGRISRTSCRQRHAAASLAAQTRASAREGTSTTANPPMTSLVSGYGPSVTTPSGSTMLARWLSSPAP